MLSDPGWSAGPSRPMVRKESNSASGIIGKKAGLVCGRSTGSASTQRRRAGSVNTTMPAGVTRAGARRLRRHAHRSRVGTERRRDLEGWWDHYVGAGLAEECVDIFDHGVVELNTDVECLVAGFAGAQLCCDNAHVLDIVQLGERAGRQRENRARDERRGGRSLHGSLRKHYLRSRRPGRARTLGTTTRGVVDKVTFAATRREFFPPRARGSRTPKSH